MNKKNLEGPIRRTQLIAPFGPGALYVLPSGFSVICSGLDFWFQYVNDEQKKKLVCNDLRLTQLLNCDKLYLPPGYSRYRDKSSTIPVTIFPKWYYCNFCGRMEFNNRINPKYTCSDPLRKAKGKGKMVQVPLVAICKHGHIQEFPWREWLFRTIFLTEEQMNIPIY